MSRILFILVLLVVGYLLLKSFQRKKIAQKIDKKKHDFKWIKKKTRIVKCEQCSLHVPEVEAVTHEGKNFCSLEHAQQAQLKKSNNQ